MSLYLCPICKSKNITLFLGGYLGKVYRCSSCGYVGSLIIEVQDLSVLEELDKLQRGCIEGLERAEDEGGDEDASRDSKGTD